ncbi:DUF2029 domain-containing protein [Corynebacterium sp. HMSC078H07]|uniref:DUF2029 domain-containing protein n=1 Tax=Corynebacterium sp. HMSC078H07 TaxID=1739379 RepID=UPI001FEDB6E4|nr:DUF2029 domain-containing protein [Corynebacterium sp. HMSC078H07]
MKTIVKAPAVWAGWAIARVLLISMLLGNRMPGGDLNYYLEGVYGDDGSAMTEYPQPGTWPSVVLAWLTGDNADNYRVAFTVMMLLADALFLALLLRNNDGRRSVFAAAWFWVFFGTAAGHVFVWRLDLYPALLVAGAGTLLATHPRVASALLAWATTVKLWPGVLAAGLVGAARSRTTWQRLAAFCGTIVGICLAVAALTSVDRLVSPLSYQEERGLQIESLAATWHVLQAHRHPETWEIGYAASKSYEITGPGVDTALALSTITMVCALVWMVAVAASRFLRGGWDAHSTVVFFVAAILLLIATNKVFSPQYIVWLGPVLAVAIRAEIPRETPEEKQLAPDRTGLRAIMAILAVAAAALGTYIYPYGYDYVWLHLGENMRPVYVLVVRNLLILSMTVTALMWHRLEFTTARAAERSARAA